MSKKVINKVKVAVIGAGSRGLKSYMPYAHKHPEQVEFTAVAEPRDFYRNQAAKEYNIAMENVFKDWKELLSKPKLADMVIIATPDKMHKAPAVVAAEKGYHIFLEKPMAVTAKDCIDIVKAVKANKVLLAVAHVLRYTPFYRKVREIIDSGILGDICTINHTEGVGWWHHAHSYVRGNWKKQADSSFMLLAKSCHDIDLINWWIGEKCLNLASFGHLKHFRKEQMPIQATERCLDCPLSENGCPYSAKKFYFDKLHNGLFNWPLDVVVTKFTKDVLEKALRTGPYGKCVYACDNDVVDHQVVTMEFENRITANFTMTAFTPAGRKTTIMGTKGYLEGDFHNIKVHDFRNAKWTDYQVCQLDDTVAGGHGGGDYFAMKSFVEAVAKSDYSQITTGPDETLRSHLMVFAAEKARLESKVVNYDNFCKSLML